MVDYGLFYNENLCGCHIISVDDVTSKQIHTKHHQKVKQGNWIGNSVSKINSLLAPKPSEPRRLSGWERGEINLLTILK